MFLSVRERCYGMCSSKYSELFELATKIATQESTLEFLEKRLSLCYSHGNGTGEKKVILLRMIEKAQENLQKDKETFEQTLYYAGEAGVTFAR